jgi:putative ABC transport system permease protein
LQPLDAVLVVLALVLTVIAVAGVLNSVLLTTHERVYDIATLKTLGMSPGQVILMVCATAGFLGIVGGILGVPAGVWLHQALFGLTGSSVNDPLPQNAYAGVFIPITLPLFAIAGLVVALIGASLPARWAARQSVVETLRAE